MSTTKKEPTQPRTAEDVDPNLPADAGKRDPVSPAVQPVPATTLDIPANEPYPTGSPAEPSYLEINGLVPPPAKKTEG